MTVTLDPPVAVGNVTVIVRVVGVAVAKVEDALAEDEPLSEAEALLAKDEAAEVVFAFASIGVAAAFALPDAAEGEVCAVLEEWSASRLTISL